MQNCSFSLVDNYVNNLYQIFFRKNCIEIKTPVKCFLILGAINLKKYCVMVGCHVKLSLTKKTIWKNKVDSVNAA